MKVNVPISRANRLINTGCVILVASKYRDKVNIVTIAWQTPISHKPMLVGVCVAKTHFSHKLISLSREYVINVPNLSLLKQAIICGSVSGKNVNKFEKTGLTPLPSKKVNPPAIKECIAHIECEVKNIIPLGDHSIFVGEVVSAYCDKGVFDNETLLIGKKKAQLIHHIGGNLYTSCYGKITLPKKI